MLRKEPGRVAQWVGHLTRKSEFLGSIPGVATSWYDWNTVKKGVKSQMICSSNTVKNTDKIRQLSFPVSTNFPLYWLTSLSRSKGYFIEFKGKGCCRRQKTSAIKPFIIVGGLHRNVLLMRKQPYCSFYYSYALYFSTSLKDYHLSLSILVVFAFDIVTVFAE